MKKPIKITLFAVAILTVILVVMSVIMLKAVSGDALFYMNSTLGNIYAVSYRWVCFVSGILILFWIILVVKQRKAIMAKLLKLKRKEQMAEVADITSEVSATAVEAAETTNKLGDIKFCGKCGKQMSVKSKFCPFCGEPIIAIADEEKSDML